MDEKKPLVLTEEQLSNWRRVLPAIIGPYATMMTDEEIRRFATRLQEKVNANSPEPPE